MNSLEITKSILRENNLNAKKAFGQNFLVDDDILDRIAGCVKPDDELILEIGPGLGNLTEKLLKTNKEVLAIELDKDMINILQERFIGINSFTLINEDFLKVDIKEYIKGKKVKVIANLPYYITTPILFKLLEYADNIHEIIVMVQKEVADRLCATNKNKDYGVLTIMVQSSADVCKLFDVPNTSFVPAPKVTSSIIQITREDKYDIKNKEIFSKLVKNAFQNRRKKAVNSLINTNTFDFSKEIWEGLFNECNLPLTARAEEISIEKFVEMSNYIQQ